MAYHVYRSIQRPPEELLEPLRAARAGSVGRWMHAVGAMDHRIQAIKKPWSFIGPAVTVHVDDADSLMAMQAIDLAQPGDVVVVAAQGRMDAPCWGGGMTITSEKKGLAGAVIDGAVGDTYAILSHDFPVFARGSTPRFELRYLPGSINVPIVCGGVLVRPGDVVIGNEDGVVVVPAERLEEIGDEMRKHQANLDAWGAQLRQGRSMFQAAGLDEIIARHPIEWHD